MAQSFVCPRCGFSATKKYVFRNHLFRAFICSPTVANVSLDELKKQYTLVKNLDFECTACKKMFTSKSGLHKHKKTCFTVNTNDLTHVVVGTEYTKNLENINKTMSNLEGMITNIYSMLSNLMSEKTKMIADNNIEHVTTAGSLKIKDFGQEEILHLLQNENLMKLIFQQHEVGLLKFIDLIWFDEHHGKNHNIKIVDKDSAEFYQYQKWTPVKVNSLVHTIVDYLGCYLQQSLEHSAFLSESFLNSYMEKVGVHMEWDLSHGEWEWEGESESDDVAKRKILQSVKLHLLKKLYETAA